MNPPSPANSVRQAVIIAGGQATRLRPFTDDRPKILVEIAGQTILQRQVGWLAANGIEDLVISSGYLTDVLTEFVNSRSWPLRIHVVAEESPLGRGGGLRFAAQSLPHPDERWLGMNGDVLTDMSIPAMEKTHSDRGAVATIALASFRSPYGVVTLSDDGAVQEFLESPVLPHWINAGIYLFEPEVKNLLPEIGDHETTTFPELAAAGTLQGFCIESFWRGVDTAKDIKDVSRLFSSSD